MNYISTAHYDYFDSSFLLNCSYDAENFGRIRAPLVHGITKTVLIEEDTFAKLTKVIEIKFLLMALTKMSYDDDIILAEERL